MFGSEVWNALGESFGGIVVSVNDELSMFYQGLRRNTFAGGLVEPKMNRRTHAFEVAFDPLQLVHCGVEA